MWRIAFDSILSVDVRETPRPLKARAARKRALAFVDLIDCAVYKLTDVIGDRDVRFVSLLHAPIYLVH